MSDNATDAASSPTPPPRVTIKLAKNWDAGLSYGILTQKKPATVPIFVGRRELLGPIVNAIGQPDRRGTYLISGYRGAGKTTLVTEAARRARTKLERENWHLLPIVLNVSEVSASLSSAAEPTVGPLQIEAKLLLTALLRQLQNDFDPKAGAATTGRSQPERSLRLRIAARAKRLRGGSRVETKPQPDPRAKLADAIAAAYRKAAAAQYSEKTQQLREDRRREATESRLGLDLPNLLKLIAALATFAAVGIGIGIAVGPFAAALASLAAAAVISFQWSRTVSRATESTDSAAIELTNDNSVHQLENDLKDIFTQLYGVNERTIVVLEELDKVDDSEGRQLDAVIRYFKNLFTQAPALFFFLTDKQYYDLIATKIEHARSSRTYSIEHTFFTHRLFVNRPTLGDCLEYLAAVADDAAERKAIAEIGATEIDRVRDLPSMDLRERFLRVLLFRTQNHIFDLKNEMRRYMHVDDSGTSILECDDETLPLNEQAFATFHFLIEQKARSYGFRAGRDYANEVLRNSLFSVFADSDPSEPRELRTYYPLQGPGGDQLGATEESSIVQAVDSLVEDLERGGAVERDVQNGQFTWHENAAVRFSPVAKPEPHEDDLVQALKRNIALLSTLGEGGVLHGVFPDSAAARDLVGRFQEEVKSVGSLRRPLPKEQATSMTSSAEADIARILTSAFDAHRTRLSARLGRDFEPVETSTTGSVWRLRAEESSDGTGGEVLLVYGSGDRVRGIVQSLVMSPAETRRFGLLNVVLEQPASTWTYQQPALVQDWRQLLGTAGSRVACSAVSLDEGLVQNVEERWTATTGDELILLELWVQRAWTRLAPESEDESPQEPGRYIVRASDPEAAESTYAALDQLIAAWIGARDRVLCWVTKRPTLSAVAIAFEQPLESAPGSLCVYLPASATVPGRALALWAGVPPEYVEGRMASLRRLIEAGRIVLGLDYRVYGELPGDHTVPANARVVMCWDVGGDAAAKVVPAAAVSTLHVDDDPAETYSLAVLVETWNTEQARGLLELAAEHLPLAMGHLAFALRTSDPAESQKWRERLLATGDVAEIRHLAETVLQDDAMQAAAWFEIANKSGDPEVMGAVADVLDRFDKKNAGLLRRYATQRSTTGGGNAAETTSPPNEEDS